MNYRNYTSLNPIAKQLFEGHYGSLFENEKVDALLQKISDHALNTFKILVFDLAPKRDRRPDSIREKLSKLANSKSVSSLTATMQDLASENDLGNSKYSESKRLYLEALGKFSEALNRSHEINKSKDEVILKIFKLAPTKIQNQIDNIAKEDDARKKEMEKVAESWQSWDEDSLFENLFTGYRSRVESLKKLLVNLITSAEGKDQKSGYQRDWKRTFLELEQKRQALDSTDRGHGSRDKKDLEQLEKDVEKFQGQFNDALVQAANRSLQNLEQDEELYSSFSDVTALLGDGLDFLTRALAQNKITRQEIKSETEEKENTLSKSVFPIKKGNKDTDERFKNSGLILAIQQLLCNSIPSAKKLISSKGGPNGNFGPATQSVISTIQKISGNKNTSGELDRALLDDILSSDWVDVKDKEAVVNCLDKIRSKMNEQQNFVLNINRFIAPLNEEKIVLNKSEFEKELDVQYKNFSTLKDGEGDDSEIASSEGSSSNVNTLAKLLRKNYDVKIETEDFLKKDGSLKASYSPNFIKAWVKSIQSVSGEKDKFSYFFFSDGIYNINLKSASLKNPCNLKKWSKSRMIADLDDEDFVSFFENYLRGWVTFGLIRPQFRYDGIKSLIAENNEDEKFEYSNIYELMDVAIKNKNIPFISFDDLKGDISKAFRIAAQKDEKEPDLEIGDFIAINNFLVMLANAISFDGKKAISCLKWIHDNVLGEATCKRISKDAISPVFLKSKKYGKFLGFKESSIVVVDPEEVKERKAKNVSKTRDGLEGFASLADMKASNDSLKSAIGKNIDFMIGSIYPSIESHVDRMNAKSFEDIPQNKPFMCYNSEM